METIDVTLKHPFRATLVGAAASGKSSTILNLLRYKKRVISCKLDLSVYVYMHWQHEFEKIQEFDETVVFLLASGIYFLEDIIKTAPNSMVILDDLQILFETTAGSSFITSFFIHISTHLNCSCIALLHNLYARNLRSVALNSSYTILHVNNRDRVQIETFGRQLLPRTGGFLLQSYLNATSTTKFGSLTIDHTIQQSDQWRIRNFFFVHPELESNLKFYIPEKKGDKIMSKTVHVISDGVYAHLIERGLISTNPQLQSKIELNCGANNLTKPNSDPFPRKPEQVITILLKG